MKKSKKIFFLISILFAVALMFLVSCNNQPEQKVEYASNTSEYDWSVNSTDVIIEKGTVYKIVACYGAEQVYFSVDNDSIISVSQDGTVTPLNKGVAYVIITASNTNKNVVFKVTVTDGSNYKVEFDEFGCDYVLKVNAVKTFSVKTYIENVEYQDEITWSVEHDAECVTLWPNGNLCMFKASKSGTYTLKAFSKCGGVATISVVVENN